MSSRNFFIALFLVGLVTISQFVLASKHLEFGFFTDDWLFLSAYRSNVINPILDILNAWKNIGSHNFAHAYYIGVLYNFFGLDYFSYHFLNQILKIIATLSLYPLVLIISKNKLLAFLSTLFYSFHYSPFGTLDNASRGEDFIAIISMNLFLFAYYFVLRKGYYSTFLVMGFAIWLIFTIFIDPTRLFPLIVVIPFIELLNITQSYRLGLISNVKKEIKVSVQRLLILYLPFIPLFLISPHSITVQLSYSSQIFEKLRDGNWQLLLTPFASLGSMYIPKQAWFIFSNPVYSDLGSYLAFLLPGIIVIFLIFYSAMSFFISEKPLKFVLRSLGLNLFFAALVFIASHNWIFLDQKTRAPVDPGTYLIPALIGMFIFSVIISLFLDWKESNKKNNLLPPLFIGPLFSLVFIYLTWFFADINSIFTGVHAYLNIPSIGVSVSLAALLSLFYSKIKSTNVLGKVMPIVLIAIMLGSYFKISTIAVDDYFSYWLDNGLRATDQRRIMDQFWDEVEKSERYSEDNLPIINLDTASGEYKDGAYYAEVIIWRLASWFDLKFKKDKERRFNLCDIEIFGKAELDKFVRVEGNKLISNKCEIKAYEIKNFYSFKFKDQSLVPNREEVLGELGIK